MIERDPMTSPQPGDRFLHNKGHYAFVATMLGMRKGYNCVYGYTVRLIDGTRGNKTCRSITTLQQSFTFERHEPQQPPQGVTPCPIIAPLPTPAAKSRASAPQRSA